MYKKVLKAAPAKIGHLQGNHPFFLHTRDVK